MGAASYTIRTKNPSGPGSNGFLLKEIRLVNKIVINGVTTDMVWLLPRILTEYATLDLLLAYTGIVQTILYFKIENLKQVQHGNMHESNALLALEKLEHSGPYTAYCRYKQKT